jgi:hypothetical protein
LKSTKIHNVESLTFMSIFNFLKYDGLRFSLVYESRALKLQNLTGTGGWVSSIRGQGVEIRGGA